MTHANENDWIEFMSDRNPCAADDIIDVRLRSGKVLLDVFASDCRWSLWNHTFTDGDIVAYRMVEP